MHVGAGVDRHGVVAAPGFEAAREQVDLYVGADAVVVLEVTEHRGGHLGIGEEHGAAVDHSEDVTDVQVAAHREVQTAQRGDGHELRVVAERGVELVAVGIVVEEISRVGVLRSGAERHGGDGRRDGHCLYDGFHCLA